MEIHPAPSYANIYLAERIDEAIIRLGNKYGMNGESTFKTFKIFLDDIFQVITGTTKELHNPILDTRISVRPSSFVTLRGPPLDSETGWTGELWSKTNLLNWQN